MSDQTEAKPSALDWCSIAELARRWGVSTTTVQRNLFVREQDEEPVPPGKLLAMKIGGQYRVHVSAVEAYEKRGKWMPVPAEPEEIRKAMRVARKRQRMALTSVPNHLGDL